ncbi:hypothetical protein GIB67_039517, partial [Kingdonia uniflora]
MVECYFLVPSLILREETLLDASSWCPDSSGEVKIPMLISFSLVELVQYIVPLYPTISGKVNPFSAVVSPLYSWGLALWIDIAKPIAFRIGMGLSHFIKSFCIIIIIIKHIIASQHT